jgi:hypothetical protein
MKQGSSDALALVLDDAIEGMSAEEVAESLAAQLEPLSEAQRLSFDRALQTIGQAAQRAAPGVVRGATAGSVAGPWGAFFGGATGGALSLAGGAAAKRQQQRVPNGTAPPPPPIPPSPTPNQPAAQLLALLQDPRLLQAVAALVVGDLGRREVSVDQTAASPPAFLNLLRMLALQAAQEAEPLYAEACDSYLRGPDGEYVCDVVSPVERARALMEHLESEWASPVWRQEEGTPEDWLLDTGLAEFVDPVNNGAW